jgi:Ca2+-binding RTX toxin-like protein
VIVTGAAVGPAWSPAHRSIAYFQDGIRVVDLALTDDRQLAPPWLHLKPEQPSWSPDGSSVAYWAALDSSPTIVVSQLDGTTRTFPVKDGLESPIVWGSTGSLLAANRDGYVRIDLSTSAQRQILGARGSPTFPQPTFTGATFSRDGSSLAYSTGGECRDRLGIYVAKPDGSDPRRISNSCRIVGTEGPDVLHGDWSRVVLGLGGDDTLYADDTGYYFQANTLYGGAGNDTLYGGHGDDTLYGGPGDDVIDAGLGSDVINGGAGHDHIDAGRGADVIYARDGEIDWIDCGKPGYAKRDVVYADRVDVVASDCKVVHRR